MATDQPPPSALSSIMRCEKRESVGNIRLLPQVSATCAVVIFRVKVSCIKSVDGIKLWVLI